MYADRANMILMTGFLICGMVTVPVTLVVLWHLHSKKKRELRQLKENLRMRNMYGNAYMVPPGSASQNGRMFATLEGTYDGQRWMAPPQQADADHWTAMRMMLGSRDQPRQLGATTTQQEYVMGNSGQFNGPLYRPQMVGPPATYQSYAPVAQYNNAAVPIGIASCQKPMQPNNGPNNGPFNGSPLNTTSEVPMSLDSGLPFGGGGAGAPQMDANQWRALLLQAQQQGPPPSVAASTGSVDWVKTFGNVPRQIDVSLDHANTVGGCVTNPDLENEHALSETNSQQPPPIQTKLIPASQLAS